MTLMQDARKGRLQVRFSSATGEIVRHNGFLGIVDLTEEFSLDAAGIKAALGAIIQRAAIAYRGAPYTSRKALDILDHQLYKHILSIVEAFVTDAAADEVLACHQMQEEGVLKLGGGFEMENIRLVIRDKPHASRRWPLNQFASSYYLHLL